MPYGLAGSLLPMERKMSNNDAHDLIPDQNKISQKESQLSRRRFMQHSAGTLLAAGAVNHLTLGSAVAAPKPTLPQSSENDPHNDSEILARYQRAEAVLKGLYGDKLALNTTIFPTWVSDRDFWYLRETKSSKQYRLVNAQNGFNRTAFDHKKLAGALSKASGEKIDASNLPLADINITLLPRTVRFVAFGKHWVYDEGKKSCRQEKVYPKEWSISPNGKKAVFVREYNLWLRDLKTGKERPLTKDGEKFYVYAGTPTVYGRQELPSLEAIWSPDSKRVFTIAIDTRKVKVGPPLVEHVPTDGSLRPKVVRADRRVAFPEDEHIEACDFFAIEVQSGKIQKADFRPSPVLYPPTPAFLPICVAGGPKTAGVPTLSTWSVTARWGACWSSIPTPAR